MTRQRQGHAKRKEKKNLSRGKNGHVKDKARQRARGRRLHRDGERDRSLGPALTRAVPPRSSETTHATSFPPLPRLLAGPEKIPRPPKDPPSDRASYRDRTPRQPHPLGIAASTMRASAFIPRAVTSLLLLSLVRGEPRLQLQLLPLHNRFTFFLFLFDLNRRSCACGCICLFLFVSNP